MGLQLAHGNFNDVQDRGVKLSLGNLLLHLVPEEHEPLGGVRATLRRAGGVVEEAGHEALVDLVGVDGGVPNGDRVDLGVADLFDEGLGHAGGAGDHVLTW